MEDVVFCQMILGVVVIPSSVLSARAQERFVKALMYRGHLIMELGTVVDHVLMVEPMMSMVVLLPKDHRVSSVYAKLV